MRACWATERLAEAGAGAAGGLPGAGRRLVEHERQEDSAAADGGHQRQPVPRAPGRAGRHARPVRRLLRDHRALGARRLTCLGSSPGLRVGSAVRRAIGDDQTLGAQLLHSLGLCRAACREQLKDHAMALNVRLLNLTNAGTEQTRPCAITAKAKIGPWADQPSVFSTSEHSYPPSSP